MTRINAVLQESLEDLGSPNGTCNLLTSPAPAALALWAVPQRQTEIIVVGRNSKKAQSTWGCRKWDSLILLPLELCANKDKLSYKILVVSQVTLPFSHTDNVYRVLMRGTGPDGSLAWPIWSHCVQRSECKSRARSSGTDSGLSIQSHIP